MQATSSVCFYSSEAFIGRTTTVHFDNFEVTPSKMFLFADFLVFSLAFIALTMFTRALRNKSINRRHPPSLPSLPIVGSLPFIRKFDNIPEFFMSKVNQLGPIFTFNVGRSLCLVLNSKEVIEEALVKNSACFAGRANFYIETVANKNRKGIVGRDFTAEFKRYHKLSLSILKEFGFGINRLIETRILEEFEAMTAFIRSQNGEVFNPKKMASLSTYNVIKNIVLGKRNAYEDGIDEILKHIMASLRNATLVFDIAPSMAKLLPYFNAKLKLFVESVSRACAVIKEDIENIKIDKSVRCFVSSYLAKVGPDYDQEQLIYTVRDFLAAGYETTAATLLWLLVFVANNPEIKGRLQKEIDAVIPKSRLPSLDDQPKLPFVEATILETLRFRTAIPIAVPHLTLTDSEVCGYIIPEGTKVLPNLQAAHMDPKVWKDPDVFRPERFLDKDNNIIGRDEVIPFSLGRRSCLGEILARQEMFLFFAGWIQRFNILLGEDGQQIDDTPIVKVTTTPRPFKIRMIPRDI